ncbi:MAG TPA: PepSY domain-containing protein, partial [Vicinamibacteria bacterium]|nr:PepSY domain-containing protein [Vicinamibacteria bacterium]
MALVLPTDASATQPKQPVTDLDQAAFFKPELYISSSHAALADIQSRLPNREAWDTFLQARAAGGGDAVHVYIDPRSGAATNIVGAFPIIPGSGAGNTVTLSTVSRSLGRSVRGIDAETVAALVRRFVVAHQDVLAIDVRQLGTFTATQVNPDLWQVSAPQQVNGVPVRHGRLAATISHGNLVVIGTETWGNAAVDIGPAVAAEFALDAGFAQAGGRALADVLLQEPALEVIPVAPLGRQQGDLYVGEVGAGYEHRLVWSFVFQRPPEHARWEVMVDAHTGDVLSLQDINHYVQRRVT